MQKSRFMFALPRESYTFKSKAGTDKGIDMTPTQTANISIGIVLVTMGLIIYVALGLPWVTSFVAEGL